MFTIRTIHRPRSAPAPAFTGYAPSLFIPPPSEFQRPQRSQGPPYILNGPRFYSRDHVRAAAKLPVIAQYCDKSGRVSEAVPCKDQQELAVFIESLPQSFQGGYVSLRHNPVHVHVPRPKRNAWDW